MLKRRIILLLTVCLLCGLAGCTSKEPIETACTAERIEDIYPDMEYGVWETDALKSEPGNYDRTARVSNGSWAETGSGYYYYAGNLLYYSDKANLNNWIPLCGKPKCNHSMNNDSACDAYAPNGVCFDNNRIYYLAYSQTRPELYAGKKKGYILCSMAMDGTDHKLEFAWEDAMLSSAGGVGGALCQTGAVFGTQEIQNDGTCVNKLYLADGEGARCLTSWSESNDNTGRIVAFAGTLTCLTGEIAFNTNFVEVSGSVYSSVVWEEDGQLYNADLSEFPHFCAYFFDGNLRFFRANDGYYDVDLITMEEVKLCDAQLENSGVRFLQANCILESNLFYQNTFDPFDSSYTALPRVGEGALRLFNGQQWLDVELPEELKHLSADEVLHANTITSEYILFRATVDGTDRYYRLDLAAENLKLEYWFEMN